MSKSQVLHALISKSILFFCRDHCICLSLPLSAFPVSSCVFFFLFCFVFRDVLLLSQRLLLPLSWITSGDEFSLNYYMGDRELLCSATTIFSPVMGTLSPAADLQHTSPLISASFMLLVPFLTLQREWEEHLLDCDKWCPAVLLLWCQNFTVPLMIHDDTMILFNMLSCQTTGTGETKISLIPVADLTLPEG